MSNTNLPPIAERDLRVQAAVNLTEGDRVPFVPSLNNFYAYHYGVTTQDAMHDIFKVKEPVLKYLKDYDPDLVYEPAFFPIEAMELIGHNQARWPGEYYNLPENTPYQYIDHEYITDDDWDEYFRDPSLFMLTKIFPRKYKALEPLAMLDLYGMSNHCVLSFASAGIPPVAEALRTIAKTGEIALETAGKFAELSKMIVGEGYPIFGGSVVTSPFDDFADNMRGLMPACMDIKTDPELIDDAVNRWADVLIPNYIKKAKMTHAKYAFIPLHCGVDNFMSVDDYNKHYWPTLKRLINEIINIGVTPFVFCEGEYNTRLETLTDVPKGKVIYAFEDVDFARAKKVLGDTACICGGMPTQTLMKGDVTRIEDEVKKMMDICAPGGGYIMSNSLALDEVSPEAMHAWHEATIKYGTFK